MVAYSFKPRFVLPIELGEKRQTIRAPGKKRHARAGETLQLYTGPRMKPRKIGEATCQVVATIDFDFEAGKVVIGQPVANIITGDAALDHFARLDGFADWQALVDFWAETHDVRQRWSGLLIQWGQTFRGGLGLNPSTAGD